MAAVNLDGSVISSCVHVLSHRYDLFYYDQNYAPNLNEIILPNLHHDLFEFNERVPIKFA